MSAPLRPDQQRRFRIAILIIGTITVLSFLFADPLLRTLHKRDQIGAVPQQGIATVVIAQPPRSPLQGTPEPAFVEVRFRGVIYTAKTVIDFEQLKQDQPAQIVYRVGRGGTIYVDQVEPLKSGQ